MTKKLNILIFLVIIPNIMAVVYDKLFRYSSNWFEDYQNFFKLGFVIISVISTGWLVLLSKKDKSYGWLWFAVGLLILLIIYLYFAIAVVNSSY
ncbi:MAG: hypothetical protein WC794_01920 [Candidatus Doudnabacteria bacterium]|jgi:hypothetical protein